MSICARLAVSAIEFIETCSSNYGARPRRYARELAIPARDVRERARYSFDYSRA